MFHRSRMKSIVSACAVVLFSACLCFAQSPTPPSDGIGLGNSHLSPNSSVDNILSMSANVNSIITDIGGSTTGNKGNPAFAGSPGADTATRVNSSGTAALTSSVSATTLRRAGYARPQAPQKKQGGNAQPKQQKSSNKVQ